MGVPYLFYYYYNKYNKEDEIKLSIDELKEIDVDNLFFDYNSLIHPCANQILLANYNEYILIKDEKERINKIEDDIIKNCINYTNYIINQIKIKNVYIVIDGVAPRSKMNQQRERRYKSYFLKSEENIWDTNNITPGTLFMDKLNKRLELEFKEYIILNSEIEGEGEHKIMNILNNLETENKNMIYGLDCDLIFLSLLNKNSDKIILIRDNKDYIDYIDIKHIKNYIYKDILSKLNVYDVLKNKIIEDYVFLCFLLGNDFLNNIPSLFIKKDGINVLIDSYVYGYENDYLINNYKINVHFFVKILNYLKNHENEFLRKYRKEKFIDYELINKVKENNCNIHVYEEILLLSNYKKSYKLYYNLYDHIINDICYNYIEGLIWIFMYYKGHIHENWSWYYRYHNSPFISDIYNYVINNIDKIKKIEFIRDKPFSKEEQLLLVLPKECVLKLLRDLNKNALINFVENSDIYYPDNIFIDIDNKQYLWQSKIFLNNINEKLINLLVRTK